MLSSRWWYILLSVWVFGMIASPVAAALGVDIPPIAYIGYSSLCTFILANHPKIGRLVKALDAERERDSDEDGQ